MKTAESIAAAKNENALRGARVHLGIATDKLSKALDQGWPHETAQELAFLHRQVKGLANRLRRMDRRS